MSSNDIPVEGAPVAPKVLAGTLGAASGGAIGTAAVWTIGIFCPGGTFDAKTVEATIAACPSPIAQLVPIVLAGIGAFWAGYAAPHQQRLEDVTAAIAKYVVGSNETDPAPHDAAPADAEGDVPAYPVWTVGDPGNDGEDLADDTADDTAEVEDDSSTTTT